MGKSRVMRKGREWEGSRVETDEGREYEWGMKKEVDLEVRKVGVRQ